MKKFLTANLIFLAYSLSFGADWANKLADHAESILADIPAQVQKPTFETKISQDSNKLNFKSIAAGNQLLMAADPKSSEILFCEFVAPGQSVEVPRSQYTVFYVLNEVDGVRHTPVTINAKGVSEASVDAQWLMSLAKQGKPFPQFIAGTQLLRGENVPPDFEAAYEYLTKSAAQDNPAAMLALSQMFRDGIGVEKNEKTSFEYANAALSFGYIPAFTYVGYALANGMGTEQDIPKALRHLEHAANAGDDSAMLCLSAVYTRNIKDDAKAMEYIERAINAGNRFALEVKADALLKNNADAKEAIALYIRAAQRNSPTTAFRLARLIQNDFAETNREHYKEINTNELLRAAEKNVLASYRYNPARGFYTLARLYAPIMPEVGRLNMAYAYALLQKSSEKLSDTNKIAIAMGAAEYLYKNAKQPKQAIALCEKTYAQFKNVEALVELANIYSDKYSEAFDPDKALEFCEKAKLAGYDYAPLKARIFAAKNMYAEIAELYLGKDESALAKLADKEKAELIYKMAKDSDINFSAEELAKNPRHEALTQWYRHAAKLNHPDALSRMGEHFEYEKNNAAEALLHYEKSEAISATSEGALNLARLYAQGKSIEKDLEKSKDILRVWQAANPDTKSLKETDIIRLATIALNYRPIVFVEDLPHTKEFLKLAKTKIGEKAFGKLGQSLAPKTPEYKAKLAAALEELDKQNADIEPKDDAILTFREAIEFYTAKGEKDKADKYLAHLSEYGAFAVESHISPPADEKNIPDGAWIIFANVEKYCGDFDKYFEFLQKAAKDKNPETLRLLGRAHLYGIGTPSDLDKAEKIFVECAADENSPEQTALYASSKLVEIYLTKGDEAKAQKVFAEQDRNKYLKAAAAFHMKSKDYTKTYSTHAALDKLAQNAESKLIMAELTLFGLGVEKNPAKAANEYDKILRSQAYLSVESKIALAGQIAALEQSGQKQLVEQYRKNFENNNIVIAHYEGFYTGNPSIKTLFELAQRGDTFAMNLLGMYCLKVKKDFARAHAWFAAAESDFEMSISQPEKITKEDIALSKKLIWEIFDSPESAVGEKNKLK